MYVCVYVCVCVRWVGGGRANESELVSYVPLRGSVYTPGSNSEDANDSQQYYTHVP